MCDNCHRSFGKPKNIPCNFSDFVLFYDFIVNKLNKIALEEEIFLSRKTIWRRFKPFFRYIPISSDSLFLCQKNEGKWVLGADGKWLHHQGVVMIYRNVTKKVNLYWSWHPSESYDAMTIDFKRLLAVIKNTLPSGVISDWKGAIVAAVDTFLPPLPHQRCLSHVQRQLLSFLPLRSLIPATQALRRIALLLFTIDTPQDFCIWKGVIVRWKERHEYLLKERTIPQEKHTRSWWYTHGNLRRAIKLLQFDEQHLFAYLANSFLPKTNNSLEGVNSQIKGRLSNHRGMQTPQQVIYIFWLLTFSRVKTRKDLKQLWDRLKIKIFRY